MDPFPFFFFKMCESEKKKIIEKREKIFHNITRLKFSRNWKCAERGTKRKNIFFFWPLILSQWLCVEGVKEKRERETKMRANIDRRYKSRRYELKFCVNINMRKCVRHKNENKKTIHISMTSVGWMGGRVKGSQLKAKILNLLAYLVQIRLNLAQLS